MDAVKKNYIIYYFKSIAYVCANFLATGAIIQTFMLENGVSESRVSFYVSLTQIIQTLTMLFLSRTMERIKNIFKALALSYSIYVPFFVVMLFVCIKNEIKPDIKFMIIFCVSIFLSISYGITNTIVYKLPHNIMDMKFYGKIQGQAGVFSGFVSMLLSVSMSFFVRKFAYFSVMTVCSIFGIIFGLAASLLCLKFKPMNSSATKIKTESINLFKYKPFYKLIFPNFMRGFSHGIFSLITVIGYSCGVIDAKSAVVIATLTQVATLVSAQAYSCLSGKISDGLSILASGLFICTIAPFMFLFQSKIVFYILYFIAYFFLNYMSNAIPVLVAVKIDYGSLGQYTAWRMGLNALGIALGGASVPLLLKYIGATGTLFVCGVTVLPCVLGYYFFDKKEIN